MPSFKPHLLELIKTGRKTQTRRIMKPGEKIEMGADGAVVYHANGKIKWKTGRDYACYPGRGLVQECRYDLLDLRVQIADQISEADAIAEGFSSRAEFLEAWDAINGKNKRSAVVVVHTFRVKSETVKVTA